MELRHRTFAQEPKPDVLMNMGDRGRMEFVGSTARQIWLPVNMRGRMSDTAIFLFGINCSRHSAVPCMSKASRGTKDSPAIKKLHYSRYFIQIKYSVDECLTITLLRKIIIFVIDIKKNFIIK